MSTFHVSTYGSFGGALPTDQEGYVHLTVKGWVDAGKSRKEARELATVAREAVAEADEALEHWRQAGRA